MKPVPAWAGNGCRAPAESDGAALYKQGSDSAPSAQGNLAGGQSPAWHGMGADAEGHRNAAAHTGFKSAEHGGSGYNQLVFDDSDGQLRTQLATTQQHSQLNLGASITLEGGNITVECPGPITYKAAQRTFQGPVSASYPLPLMPKSICVECLLAAQASGAPFAVR
jgi:hypothetical protein